MTDHDHNDVTDEELAKAHDDLAHILGAMGISLSDPALWAEPSATASVPPPVANDSPHDAPSTRARWLIPAMAALAALVVGVAIGWGLGASRSEAPADWEVALVPTGEAPGASAVVHGWNTTGGTRLVVDVAGLEPAPDGFVYELWFSNRDRHISAGTFTDATDLEMLVGIRRGDFPRVWITLEPLDADPGPARTILDVES